MKEMKLMLLVLLVAVTGCKSSDNSLTLLRAKEWQLKSMTENGKEVKNPQQIPTLVFSDSSAVYGSAGCNRFFGTYEVGEKGKMTFKTGGATMMFCPDMPVEDFLKVIDNITPYVEPNKVLIIFTGGEALVRKDIEKCGLELYRRGYPWGIVSNGYLMTRERLDSLLASGLHSATISLDGFEEAHNWLRRNPKSFEKALNAICMLAEEKEIIWDVVTCVNQRNFKDLMLFKDFLIEMGVKRWRIFTIFPVGRAATETDLQLTNEQFTWVMNFIRFCR